MRKYVLCMLFLLLLAACQSTPQQAESPTPTPAATGTPTPAPTPSPTPEPTSVGVEVDVGDGEHKFWVELTEEGEEKRVNIYEKQGDTRPLQTFEDKEGFVSLSMAGLTAEDVNFDGYMDFHFCTSFGYSIVSHSSYYVWDPEQGCFVPDPYGLNELSAAEFWPYTKEVSSLSRGPMGTLVTSYQYENGALVKVGESFDPEEENEVKAYSAHRVKVDEDHVFWVELVDTDTYGNLMVNIYEKPTDREPVQSFDDWCECSFERIYFHVEDVDFDGDMDFSFITARGHFSVSYSSYYVWDGEKFVPDPYGLNEVCYANFHPETKIVESIRINSIASHEIQLYRYIDGKLTCLRELLTWDPSGNEQKLTVLDWKNGEWVTAYETIIDFTKLEPGDEFDPEFSRWHDLDYRGE